MCVGEQLAQSRYVEVKRLDYESSVPVITSSHGHTICREWENSAPLHLQVEILEDVDDELHGNGCRLHQRCATQQRVAADGSFSERR